MTVKERVTAALSHKEPDKTPVSFGATIVDGITGFSKDALEAYLGFEKTSHVITHKPMGTVELSPALMAHYQLDFETVRLKAPWKIRPASIPTAPITTITAA